MSGLVRFATPDDCTAIQQIYAYHVETGTASFETIAPDDAEMSGRIEGLLKDDYPFGVYERNGEVLGYCYVGPYRARYAYRFTVENSVYVRHDAMGHSIGSELIKWLIEECRARDYREIIAVIGDSANTASIALHRKCGFTYVGTLKNVGYKFEKWLDSVLMQFRL